MFRVGIGIGWMAAGWVLAGLAVPGAGIVAVRAAGGGIEGGLDGGAFAWLRAGGCGLAGAGLAAARAAVPAA